MAFTALSLRHVDRSLQSLDDLVGIAGIDGVLSRAREARQDKYSGIILVLRSNIFLGDQVHPVAQRGDEADMIHVTIFGPICSRPPDDGCYRRNADFRRCSVPLPASGTIT